MNINLDNYKKEDIKDPWSAGKVDGMEDAIEDLDCAVDGYFDEQEYASPTIEKIHKELIEDFVRYAKDYLRDQADMCIVATLDEEAED